MLQGHMNIKNVTWSVSGGEGVRVCDIVWTRTKTASMHRNKQMTNVHYLQSQHYAIFHDGTP